MNTTIIGNSTDGRTLRSRRSRAKIIDSILELIGEGNLEPTAQQVAEHAGVGIRSVFRHFTEMESLFVEADRILYQRFHNTIEGGKRDGELKSRMRRMVQRRCESYETVAPYYLCTKIQMWRSPAMRENYARNNRALFRDLKSWLPEVQALPRAEQHAIEMLLSFEAWHRLRQDQGLSKRTAQKVVSTLLGQLLS